MPGPWPRGRRGRRRFIEVRRRLLRGERMWFGLFALSVLALVMLFATMGPSGDARSSLVRPELPPTGDGTSGDAGPDLPPAGVDNPLPASESEPGAVAGPMDVPPRIPTLDVPPPPRANRPARPAPVAVTREAESPGNSVDGETRIRPVIGASGDQVIGHLGRRRVNTLRFNDIVVPTAGTYTLTIFYISGESRNATIRVNDGLADSVSFPSTADWQTVRPLTMRVKLVAGANTIEFGNPNDSAPDIDRLSITP